jgi:hypothetical protein
LTNQTALGSIPATTAANASQFIVTETTAETLVGIKMQPTDIPGTHVLYNLKGDDCVYHAETAFEPNAVESLYLAVTGGAVVPAANLLLNTPYSFFTRDVDRNNQNVYSNPTCAYPAGEAAPGTFVGSVDTVFEFVPV